MTDHLKEYWAQIIAAAGALIWFVRVEAAVRANERELRRQQYQRNEDQAAHKEARQSTNAMLAEVRSDIKELLRRNLT
nr:hypothetical protein [uncultured Celeribacter sp.]